MILFFTFHEMNAYILISIQQQFTYFIQFYANVELLSLYEFRKERFTVSVVIPLYLYVFMCIIRTKRSNSFSRVANQIS
jgi:hypothetical protein